MRNLTKTGVYISNRIGKAIADYNLIEDKDKILVGVSGGKDSLALVKLLNERRRWAPVHYDIIAMHVETDLDCSSAATKRNLAKFFKANNIPYIVEKIKIRDKKNKTSCFWCSWNRRKAMFIAANRLGCNKIALGHHQDDIVETLLLNLFYIGEFSGMNPRQELFKGKVVIIRPLCYVQEAHTRRFARESQFPTDLSSCPNAQTSKRRKMKELIADIGKTCPYVKLNLFKSMARINREYLQIHPSCAGTGSDDPASGGATKKVDYFF